VKAAIEAKGIHPLYLWANGYRQITSSTKPIRNADDLAGFKIRTPAAAIWLDLFRTLGASPTPMNFSEVYTSLQTHVIDGQENPFGLIESARLFEVQKYLSVTNHMWSGYWLIANGDAWTALPPDIQKIVSRNAKKYGDLQNTDVALYNASLADKLARRGMILNYADTATFRAKLGPFYAKERDTFGPTAWGLLEASVGKLG
jgi:tripartite ATP-independent transporter DctP family solute receptor